MIQTVATKPYRRPEARHLGPAQEDDGLPAAELCRELRPVDLRFARRLCRQDPGDRRRRPLLQSRGDPEGDPHRARQRFGRIVVGRGGLLSTPAASALIRSLEAYGGIILSASSQSRRPRRRLRHQIHAEKRRPGAGKNHRRDLRPDQDRRRIKTLEAPDVDLDALGVTTLDGGTVEIVDLVTNYAALMRMLFDFDAHPRPVRLRLPHALRRDARHHGPYAHAILEGELGAPAGHGGQRHAAARFRRRPSRSQPHLRQGALR